MTKGLFTTVADDKASDVVRLEAAKQIVEFQPESEEAASQLVASIVAKTSPELSAGIFEVLSRSRAKNAGAAVVAKLKDLPATVRPIALRVVLSRPESAKAFLDAVEKGELRFDILQLDQKSALSTQLRPAMPRRRPGAKSIGECSAAFGFSILG